MKDLPIFVSRVPWPINFAVLRMFVSNTMNSTTYKHSQLRQVPQPDSIIRAKHQEKRTMDQGKNCDEIGKRGHVNISWH